MCTCVCLAQAGSDSLLTSATFIKLAKTFFAGVESMDSHRDVLYGLGLVHTSASLHHCLCLLTILKWCRYPPVAVAVGNQTQLSARPLCFSWPPMESDVLS